MITEQQIEQLVRPNIRELTPYRSARDDYDSGILLDANENSFGSPVEGNLHRYPSPRQPELRRRLAEWRGVQPENVFAGVGSDEAIDLLLRIFCRPGADRILITPPTYGMYRVSAQINDVGVDEAVLDEAFQPRVEQILDAVTDSTKLLFLCSPNNPTGNLLDAGRVTELIERFPGIVVVDEAYIDFSAAESRASEVLRNPNLVVLQTFSKSMGLAGARLGTAYAGTAIISYLMKVKPPYNVSSLTISAGMETLDKMGLVRERVRHLVEERERLSSALSGLPDVAEVFPSQTNYLLVRVTDALRRYRQLAEAGVIVRYRGNEPLCEECLRITVGTPEENDRLIQEFKTPLP